MALTPRSTCDALIAHSARILAVALLCTGCTGVIEAPTERTAEPASAFDPPGGAASDASQPGSTVDDAAPHDGAPAAPTVSGDGSSTNGEPSTNSGDAGESTETPAVDVPVTGLALREVAIYQGVKITIAQGTSDVTVRKANVVSGRPALLRVFVDPDASFTPRTVVARLTLQNAGVEPLELEQQLQVSAASRDEAKASTFNFDLAGDLIKVDTEFSLALLEAPDAADFSAAAVAANRVPETGVAPLGARSTGSPFRVVVVPVRYLADGSGRTPNMSAAIVQSLRDQLFRLMPTSGIELSVRAPMDFKGITQPDGTGWSDLLEQCLSQRSADKSDAKTYYYCMFDPAPNFGNYCGRGCVAGLGPVPGARDTFSRAAIGVGFGDGAETMAHELGHTLGRPHAPCGGVAGPDPAFPYSGGKIGAWGYDLLSTELLDPATHTDLMGYCDKAWISDYNYELILERFQSVLNAPQVRPDPVELLSIVIDADQSLRVGRSLTLTSRPQGEQLTVHFFDAQGALLDSAVGTFVAVSHVSGGLVYVPRPPAGAVRAELSGFGTLPLN